MSQRRTHAATRPLAVSLFLLTLVGLIAPSSQARRFQPRLAVAQTGSRAALLINGQTALSLPAGHARLEAAATRLARTGASEVTASRVTRRHWRVETPGGIVILDIPRSQARDLGMTSKSLARRWAGAISRLLVMPPLAVTPAPRPVIIPTGKSRTLRIGGAALARAVHAADANPRATASDYNPGTRTVAIRGLTPGISTVVMTATDAAGQTFERARFRPG